MSAAGPAWRRMISTHIATVFSPVLCCCQRQGRWKHCAFSLIWMGGPFSVCVITSLANHAIFVLQIIWLHVDTGTYIMCNKRDGTHFVWCAHQFVFCSHYFLTRNTHIWDGPIRGADPRVCSGSGKQCQNQEKVKTQRTAKWSVTARMDRGRWSIFLFISHHKDNTWFRWRWSPCSLTFCC